jgi:hypothetical protein
VAVARLNGAVVDLYGLRSLPPAVDTGPGGVRIPNKEFQEERFLLGWLERYPYFTRLDLLADRGRVTIERKPPGDDGIDK